MQGGDADQEETQFFDIFGPIFGSRWPLFGPPWPSPGPPGLRFNSLDPRESGLDPVSTNFRPDFFRDLNKIVFGLSTLLNCLGWPRNHHKKMRLEILHIAALVACQTELVVQFYGHVNPFHSTVAVKTVYEHLAFLSIFYGF